MATFNPTAKQIIEIHEIFNKIVDCKGNLKVFRNFDWKAHKKDVVVYKNSKGISLSKVNNATLSKLEDYYDYDSSKPNILDICKDITDYQDTGIKFDIDGYGNKFRDENINKHFNVLLNQYKRAGANNDFLQKEDFDILYGAFYKLLEICGFTLDNEGYTIFYLNIFQKLIEYFRDGKNSFYIYTGSGIKKLNGEHEIYLNICFRIRQILCLLLSRINWSSNGNGIPLSDAELRKILGDLYGTFADFRKAILEAIETIAKNININTSKISINFTKNAKNIIFYGAPGTGKTKFVMDCLDILDPNRIRTDWIQFHSGFEYEDFIDGIKPNAIQNGNLNLALTNGVFKEFCLKAEKEPNENFFFIVDEINRADIGAVFGETLSLLEEEYRGRKIKTKNYPLNRQEFSIPKNVYFIGMMNDVDKSIDCFDLALRRRFTWILMSCNYETLNDIDAKNNGYKEKCKKLNNYITLLEDDGLNLGRAYEIGHSYFLKKETMSEQEIWDRHIEPILREYIRAQFSDIEIGEKLEMAKKIFVG